MKGTPSEKHNLTRESANTGPRPGVGPWRNCYRPCGPRPNWSKID